MDLNVYRADLAGIAQLRQCFLQESNFQIRYNACHERGWADHYAIASSGTVIGYGAIKGREISERNTVFEFYIKASFKALANTAFRNLVKAAHPIWIECQSNDFGMFSMLCEFGLGIVANAALFRDIGLTKLQIPGATFRKRRAGETAFEHTLEPLGEYVLDLDGDIMATGGFFTHYNPPFADLYVEVKQEFQCKGLGAFMLQEIKKECYRAHKVPAARCAVENETSKSALRKAGMEICGYMLSGKIMDFRHLER
jgi:GNAT superfamily N-acetyltransferase